MALNLSSGKPTKYYSSNRIASIMGLAVSFLAIIFALVTVAVVLISQKDFSPGIPTIIVSVLFFGGINLFFLGILEFLGLLVATTNTSLPTMNKVMLQWIG